MLFLSYPCLLSSINLWFEPSKDRLILVWQWYNRVSCHLLAIVLTSPVTFDGLNLLSPSLSITWLCVPGPPAFQHATLKSWKWAWGRRYIVCTYEVLTRCLVAKCHAMNTIGILIGLLTALTRVCALRLSKGHPHCLYVLCMARNTRHSSHQQK